MDKAVIESPLSWLELNRANLLHNLAGVRALVGKTRIMAVVKANAYGAGAVAVARELSAAGIDLFGVANVREGVELREDGIVGTIVGLTYFTRDEIDAILDFDLTPAIFTVDAANALSERARALNRRARVWIKIDTGLGRIGVPFQVARDFIAQIARLDGLEVVGVFSTLTENPARDKIQIQRLYDLRRQLPERIRFSIASSNGVLSSRESYLDVVRPGIMLLGATPSDHARMDANLVRQADLEPVVAWKTQVGYVKIVSQGEQIGYGVCPALTSDARIATLTIGWSTGYPPAKSAAGHVLIRGRRCPVIAVSANSTMVEVTGLTDVTIGEPVVLLGKQDDDEITAAELARVTGESVYRLLSAVPRETPRIWV